MKCLSPLTGPIITDAQDCSRCADIDTLGHYRSKGRERSEPISAQSTHSPGPVDQTGWDVSVSLVLSLCRGEEGGALLLVGLEECEEEQGFSQLLIATVCVYVWMSCWRITVELRLMATYLT